MKRLSTVNKIFSLYQRTPAATRLFILIRYLVCPWDRILKYLAGIESLLDIGCGHGLFLHLAQQRLPALKCTGIDHDQKKIAQARKSLQNGTIQFISRRRITDLALPKFDCVSIIDVLYSVPQQEWRSLLEFAAACIKPDGILIIKETVNTPRWKYKFCMLQEKIALEWLKYTKGTKPFLPAPGFLIQELNRAGFDVYQHRRIDHGYLWPHYLFMAGLPRAGKAGCR